MLDLSYIRDNPEVVKKALRDKKEEGDVDAILEQDRNRRELLQEIEALRHERNSASEEIARLKKKKQDAQPMIDRMREVGGSIKDLEKKLSAIKDALEDLMLRIPNLPAPQVPVGGSEEENQLVRTWGERRTFPFQPKPHYELGAELGILDFDASARITGSGFYVLKGAAALLERALINLMLNMHTREHGYVEVCPPFLANRFAMMGTGQLPKLREDMYFCNEDDLFLIPTAEVPLTNMHSNEMLSFEDLPIRYVANTACFRREAGAHGRETRGLVRVHQFSKVELVKIVHPEKSFDELESLLGNAEKILQLLNLEYRVLLLCTGDMSFASAKTYDIETFAPGSNRYLEVSSCSNFCDFQARRMNTRFRDEEGKVSFVHTLNGSGLALPRVLISLMETYQQEDGSIKIPEPLIPFMDGQTVIS